MSCVCRSRRVKCLQAEINGHESFVSCTHSIHFSWCTCWFPCIFYSLQWFIVCICNSETTKLPLLQPQRTLLQAPQQTTILQYMKDYNTMCGLGRRLQVIMVAFGTVPKVSLQELRNVLMRQNKIISVLTTIQLGFSLVAFH